MANRKVDYGVKQLVFLKNKRKRTKSNIIYNEDGWFIISFQNSIVGDHMRYYRLPDDMQKKITNDTQLSDLPPKILKKLDSGYGLCSDGIYTITKTNKEK